MDAKTCKDTFFNILDMNKDKRICETDLFRFILSCVKSNEMQQIFSDDIIIILKTIEKQRILEGK